MRNFHFSHFRLSLQVKERRKGKRKKEFTQNKSILNFFNTFQVLLLKKEVEMEN